MTIASFMLGTLALLPLIILCVVIWEVNKTYNGDRMVAFSKDFWDDKLQKLFASVFSVGVILTMMMCSGGAYLLVKGYIKGNEYVSLLSIVFGTFYGARKLNHAAQSIAGIKKVDANGRPEPKKSTVKAKKATKKKSKIPPVVSLADVMGEADPEDV